MPDTIPTPAPKRSRALPKVWQRFLYLEFNDVFFIGRCQYIKTGLFRAVTWVSPARVIRVWPWERVQTNVLVRDARPGGKSSCYSVPLPTFPPDMGQTHFVGDDCPGGHKDDLPRVEQPSSDNSVTGPTA